MRGWMNGWKGGREGKRGWRMDRKLDGKEGAREEGRRKKMEGSLNLGGDSLEDGWVSCWMDHGGLITRSP